MEFTWFHALVPNQIRRKEYTIDSLIALHSVSLSSYIAGIHPGHHTTELSDIITWCNKAKLGGTYKAINGWIVRTE